MGLFSSSSKKLTNVKFFFIVLAVFIVIAFGIAFLFSDEEAFFVGVLIAFATSVYLTLFRILKKSNDPENWLGNWKFFFTLLLFISGITVLGGMFISHDEESIPITLIVSIVITTIITIIRGIKHWRQGKKAEKLRKQQYQERLQRENSQYADELAKKDRIIRDLQSRNSELQRSRQSSSSSSTSQYNNWPQEEEERRQDEQWEREQEQKWEREQEQRRKERLEDWYREYVTIKVSFEYHIKDSEYNQDYWNHTNKEIRVTRREAMALIQAGEGALLGRLGYSNRENIRNVGFTTPYGLYDRPWNC